MEQVRDKHKIEHQQYTIQYNDRATSNLKWNKKTDKRQRVKVLFKNGPKGITLRWSPKTFQKGNISVIL